MLWEGRTYASMGQVEGKEGDLEAALTACHAAWPLLVEQGANADLLALDDAVRGLEQELDGARRDDQDDQRDSRVRAQLLKTFSDYLAVRPHVRSVRAITANPEDALPIIGKLQLAAASLLISLAEAGDRAVVEADLKMLENWVAESIDSPSIADWTDVPPAAVILDLAQASHRAGGRARAPPCQATTAAGAGQCAASNARPARVATAPARNSPAVPSPGVAGSANQA
jgi:hypothetical protein